MSAVGPDRAAPDLAPADRAPTGPAPAEVLLEARGVTVRRGAVLALDAVDLALVAGEVVAVVGPNGAGKSSLLSVLAGDLAADRGEVLLDGTPMGAVPPRERARRRAVLTQDNAVAFGFVVRDVVAMGRAPWPARGPLDEEVVRRAMERADVAALADRGYPTLSGGERARTQLARVLAQETRVLLLDEPTAALDIAHQEAVLALAAAAADAGGAVLVVLHDLSLAAAWADRVVLMAAGRVRAVGTPADVLTPELLGEVYRHRVRVLSDPGGLVVVPERPHPRRGAAPRVPHTMEASR